MGMIEIMMLLEAVAAAITALSVTISQPELDPEIVELGWKTIKDAEIAVEMARQYLASSSPAVI